MTDNGIRWGILATGGIAQTLAEDMTLSGVRVAAVASRRLESAQAFAERYAIPTAHGDYLLWPRIPRWTRCTSPPRTRCTPNGRWP